MLVNGGLLTSKFSNLQLKADISESELVEVDFSMINKQLKHRHLVTKAGGSGGSIFSSLSNYFNNSDDDDKSAGKTPVIWLHKLDPALWKLPRRVWLAYSRSAKKCYNAADWNGLLK